MRIALSQHDRALGRDLRSIRRRVISARTHEEFDSRTFNNDIAILELDESVDFTNEMSPACLPQDCNCFFFINN